MITLIKNVKVVDGSGGAPYPADVLLSGDKISAIGNFPNKQADRAIEGLGGYLAPGFIDVDTNSDHHLTLFTHPGQKDFVMQGITTIIGGNCGSSLAPLLYGSLESVRVWADVNQINVNWHTVEEFFTALQQLPLGINFGTLVGHATIRSALIGNDQRDLTDKELAVFQATVKESLAMGAFGLSTGLDYTHSRQVPYQEIKVLAEIVSQHNAVYATHLRNEKDDLYSSVNETLNIYKDTGAKTLISHMRPLLKYEKNFDSALDLIEKSASDMDFHFDIYPFDSSIIPIYKLLPLWAQKGGLKTMLATINNESFKIRLVKELPKYQKDDLIIAKAPGGEYLVGKTVADFARGQGLTAPKALLKLMDMTDLKALLFYRNINYDRVAEAIFSDRALVASDSSAFPDTVKILKHERALRTFPKFLEMAAARANYPLERAIQKITSIPAEKFNLKYRGAIYEGYYADLVLLLNNKIKYVIINGQIAVNDGEYQNAAAGRVVTRT